VSARSFRSRWLQWRPLAAAAAGIVFGMLCTSVVFAYVAPSLGKVTTLLQEGFESNSVKLRSDFPSETGVWGGGLARVVQGVDGVAPPEGRQMLRVEPDASATLTYLDRIIDLSSLPLPAAGEVRYVEVTASFHAGAGGLRDRYTLRAAAFGEAPGSLRQLWLKVPWRELEERTLAGAKRGLSTAADTTGWHKITVRVPAGPLTDPDVRISRIRFFRWKVLPPIFPCFASKDSRWRRELIFRAEPSGARQMRRRSTRRPSGKGGGSESNPKLKSLNSAS
jgi:hypothetical protein